MASVVFSIQLSSSSDNRFPCAAFFVRGNGKKISRGVWCRIGSRSWYGKRGNSFFNSPRGTPFRDRLYECRSTGAVRIMRLISRFWDGTRRRQASQDTHSATSANSPVNDLRWSILPTLSAARWTRSIFERKFDVFLYRKKHCCLDFRLAGSVFFMHFWKRFRRIFHQTALYVHAFIPQ